MLYFIIPLIHFNHKKIKNYEDILKYLERTIISLKNIDYKVSIIVICHKKPSWFNKYRKVIFIETNSNLQNILRKLDDKSKELSTYSKNKFYLPYLKLKGKYHNKDKGLKYFLGFLYISLLPINKKPKYIGLVDGDDFIHRKIGVYLDNYDLKYNQFFVNKGYLLYGNGLNDKLEINKLYPINKYSSICGSNRFFRYSYFENKMKNRLTATFRKKSLNLLFYNKKVDNHLINEIVKNINNRKQVWEILPTFLGTHRLYLPSKNYTNSFHKQFKTIFLKELIGIKFIHMTARTVYLKVIYLEEFALI